MVICYSNQRKRIQPSPLVFMLFILCESTPSPIHSLPPLTPGSGPNQLRFSDFPFLWLPWVRSPGGTNRRLESEVWCFFHHPAMAPASWSFWQWLCPKAMAFVEQPLSPAAALSVPCVPSPCSAVPRAGNRLFPALFCRECTSSGGPAALPTPL